MRPFSRRPRWCHCLPDREIALGMPRCRVAASNGVCPALRRPPWRKRNNAGSCPAPDLKPSGCPYPEPALGSWPIAPGGRAVSPPLREREAGEIVANRPGERLAKAAARDCRRVFQVKLDGPFVRVEDESLDGVAGSHNHRARQSHPEGEAGGEVSIGTGCRFFIRSTTVCRRFTPRPTKTAASASKGWRRGRWR